MNRSKTKGNQVWRAIGAVVVALLMALMFVGCSSQEQGPSSDSSNDAAVEEGSKILVAYYSATGTTKEVAEQIAADLDADLFEITPTQPYTSEDLDWNLDDSRVSVEHEDESAREVELVQATPDNFDRYETVFIGYPIWWSIAAWPVDGFVSSNNWEGKNVIPFCTSASSGLGESATRLEKLANGGTWQEGMRFSSSTEEATISEWVASLGLENN